MKVEGGCHCGAIAYEAEVDPQAARICHCTDCQTLTGSAFRVNIGAPADKFRLTRGTPKIYIKTADSGNKRAHAFCADCGGPIYAAAPENTTSYSLRVGALKQRALIGMPKQQIFCSSALPWSMSLDGIAKSERG
jgi:hypothetical protein